MCVFRFDGGNRAYLEYMPNRFKVYKMLRIEAFQKTCLSTDTGRMMFDQIKRWQAAAH